MNSEEQQFLNTIDKHSACQEAAIRMHLAGMGDEV